MSQNAFYFQIALWSQVVSSLLFIGVLLWMWRTYLQPAILSAQERHNKEIAQTERHRDEAKASLDVLHGEIAGAQLDAQHIEQRAESQAAREYDTAIVQAREAGERAIGGAQQEFARALTAARGRLTIDLLDKALAQARDEAARRVDEPVNARIVHEFANSLERGNG